MTDETIIAVATLYADALRDRVIAAEQGTRLEHVAWMAAQIPVFVREGRRDKAFRWLGFMQGVLYSAGLFTIEEMAEHNRPEPGATSDEAPKDYIDDLRELIREIVVRARAGMTSRFGQGIDGAAQPERMDALIDEFAPLIDIVVNGP